MKKDRELLFTVSAKDCVRQTFRCGGKGGQNVNKVESGVRFIHKESGAVGESTTHRTQGLNEKEAWKRLVADPKFLTWHKIESARQLGLFIDVEAQVNQAMNLENLKIENSS